MTISPDAPGTAADGRRQADERHDTEERLVARYGTDAATTSTVRAAVADAYGRLDGARVTSFVPVLVERSVRRSITAA